MTLSIRSEKISDIAVISELVDLSSGHNNDSRLINQMRDKGALLFSLVAFDNLLAADKETNLLVGHLSMSLVTIIDEVKKKTYQALYLAPLSVLPGYSIPNIENALFENWTKEYSEDFYQAIFTLNSVLSNHKEKGFVNAGEYDLCLPQPEMISRMNSEVKENLLVKEIKKGFLENVSGVVYYHEAFNF